MGLGEELGGALGEEFARLPSHSALFAESFSKVPVVTGFFLETAERGRAIEPKVNFTLHGSLPVQNVKTMQDPFWTCTGFVPVT
jgi:hypothetical protein